MTLRHTKTVLAHLKITGVLETVQNTEKQQCNEKKCRILCSVLQIC